MFSQGLTPSVPPTWAKLLSLQEFALAAWSLASLGLTPPVPWPHVQSGPTESGVTL